MQSRFNIQTLSPFRCVSKERAKSTDFTEKCLDTFFVFLGSSSVSRNNSFCTHLGILDYFGFILVRPFWIFAHFLKTKSIDAEHKKQKNLSIFLKIIHRIAQLLALALALPFLITACILTLFSMPFIWLVDKVWSLEKNQPSFHQKIHTAYHLKPTETQVQNRVNKYIFLPFMWMCGVILMTSISLLLQAFNPIGFAETAAPFFIIQNILKVMAGLTAVTALSAYLLHHATKLLFSEETSSSFDKSATVNPADGVSNINVGIYVIATLVVLTALILTLGYFTNDFGLFTQNFDFMGVVFKFMSDGFLSGFHAAASCPGLEFLNHATENTIQLISQISSAALFVIAPIPIAGMLANILGDIFDGKEPEKISEKADQRKKPTTNRYTLKPFPHDVDLKTARAIGQSYQPPLHSFDCNCSMCALPSEERKILF